MANIEKIVEKFTKEDTIEMLQTCLNELSEEEAMEQIKHWIKEHNLQAEFENMV